jgi:hypothetical protein
MLLQNYSDCKKATAAHSRAPRSEKSLLQHAENFVQDMKAEALSCSPQCKETLYLVILDECHSGATQSTLFHDLCNDEKMRTLDNFVVLIISATPYNNRRYSLATGSCVLL